MYTHTHANTYKPSIAMHSLMLRLGHMYRYIDMHLYTY